jgi:hypothetical protein
VTLADANYNYQIINNRWAFNSIIRSRTEVFEKNSENEFFPEKG